jgi:hypothetical protein
MIIILNRLTEGLADGKACNTAMMLKGRTCHNLTAPHGADIPDFTVLFFTRRIR